MSLRSCSGALRLLIVVGIMALLVTGCPSDTEPSGTEPAQSEPEQTEPPAPDGDAIYLDPSYSYAERAADLVARMTPEEKVSQLVSSRAPAIPRLGVREYGWWNEALHGVARLQLEPTGNATVLWNTTSYPIALSAGATWDPELLYEQAVLMSDEAREVAPENRLNLDFWSPTINLSRDPRWGRNDESYSEDPYLTAQMAAQFVNGMEGRSPDGELLEEGDGYLKTITTLKHYAANNSEINRLNGSSNVDERSLREYYTMPFREIVALSDVGSVMTAYNEVNDVPSTAHTYLIDELLRQTFGFDGYVTSDCDSISEISDGHRWVPPGETEPVDDTTRHAWAMTAGVDLNCNAGYTDGNHYANQVPAALDAEITTDTGRYTMNDVDVALVRLFTARMQLGEFDEELGLDVPWITAARERLAEDTWTNDDANGAVTQTPERLAMAHEVAAEAIVLLENDANLLPLDIPPSGDLDVAVIGYFANPTPTDSEVQFLGGYSSFQGANAQPNHVTPFQGIEAAVTEVNPDATITWHRGFTGTGTSAVFMGTIDPEAVEAAADADVAIVYVATDASTADEDGDRPTLGLPGVQADLIAAVGAANPNTVAVIESIGMVDVRPFQDEVSAILWSSYNGQQKGAALADVLTGSNNPSGRLPFTWYLGDEQLPDITDYTLRPNGTNPGRTYHYFDGPVSYPFGHGLSYTTFAYDDLSVTDASPGGADTIEVSVDVTNTGSLAGDEIVQLYAATPGAADDLERPIKRLVGFDKVTPASGETQTVTLSLAVSDLAFFDPASGTRVLDPAYELQVGPSSADGDIAGQTSIIIDGSLDPVLSHISAKPNQTGDTEADIPTRVIFDPDLEIDPQLTVAMSDDTLYGYIRKGNSVPLPDDMTVMYESNRPDIVTIDGTTLRSNDDAAGVATITATVTYQGATETVDFVVYVNATE